LISAGSICCGLLIVLFTVLLLLWKHETTSEVAGFWIKNVPILRTDHTSIKGTLHGIWQASYCGVFDFHEVNRRVPAFQG
jgi:hypothetical protein